MAGIATGNVTSPSFRSRYSNLNNTHLSTRHFKLPLLRILNKGGRSTVDGGCRSFAGSHGSPSFRPRFENLKNTHLSSAHFKQTLWRASDKDDRSRVAGKSGFVVRCTAEGIERGVFSGGFVMPERIKVVALMACVMCLCNADRVVMSVAIVPLAAKHGWSSSFLGIVQSSFLWGYIFSSVIGGALVDKYGGKRMIAWGVFLWSLATLLTPWAANHSTASLLAVRAFFGLAEGVAWFPCNERATAVGLSMGGFHLGNVVGLVLTPIVMASVGLSGPFYLFSSLGLLWLTTWTLGVTNDPQDSPSISSSELRLIQAGKTKAPPPLKKGELPPLRLLLSKMPTWAIIFANVTNNWGYFVLLSWMPVYFKTVFNVNLKQAAWFSAVPWGTMAFSGYVAGAASDYLIKAGHSLTFVRKVMQSIGFIGPGLALLGLNYAKTPVAASVLITVALSFSAFSQAGFLLNMQDIAPQNFKLCWNIGCHNQHDRDRLLCAMAGIVPSILNRYSRPIFCHSHILERLRYG
nr:probable anion transporter 3, chloroplastic [Tanacetum cinerariifolium]